MAINLEIEVLPSAALAATQLVPIENLNCSRGKLLVAVSAAAAGASFTPIIHRRDKLGNRREILRGRPMYGPGEYELEVGPGVESVENMAEDAFLPKALTVEFRQNAGGLSMTMSSTFSLVA